MRNIDIINYCSAPKKVALGFIHLNFPHESINLSDHAYSYKIGIFKGQTNKQTFIFMYIYTYIFLYICVPPYSSRNHFTGPGVRLN